MFSVGFKSIFYAISAQEEFAIGAQDEVAIGAQEEVAIGVQEEVAIGAQEEVAIGAQEECLVVHWFQKHLLRHRKPIGSPQEAHRKLTESP